jgi:16S rRNA C967 or C1407 C5-methylase (RsmB/RsmF family)/NOL1/NOP2/fmu family ribosome biogenesis protein
MEKLKLPGKFEARMREKLGDAGFDSFENALQQKPQVSIRVNPKKGAGLFQEEEIVPWCRFGRYLKKRPAFVFDPLYHAGAYYAQEASSMLFANAIDYSRDLKVLDLCAAPGDKSSLLLSNLSENSLLVSNELVGKRAVILYENLVKWGADNNIITNNRVSDFLAFKGFFDVVMIDAPCSGEGMFRKDREALEQWNEGLVGQCSTVQKEILTNAIELLKPGGTLIYSTCTYEQAENEENIRWLYSRYANRLQPAEIPVQESWGVVTEEINIASNIRQKGYYCYPHLLKGEGQFVAVMKTIDHTGDKKPSKFSTSNYVRLKDKDLDAIKSSVIIKQGYDYLRDKDGQVYQVPSALAPDMLSLASKLNMMKMGTRLGKMIRTDLIPDHELVMDAGIEKKIPRVELDLDRALDFMQRKNISVPDNTPKGWIIFCYQNVDIGLAKNLGNRVNNHYPSEWRIRKER